MSAVALSHHAVKKRNKNKPGDQIAAGEAQHDIGEDGEEGVNHSVDFLA